MVYDYENLIYRAISPLPTDLYMGWSETLLIMGVILRHVGPEMSMIATIFLLYNIYANSITYPWNHPGFSIDYLIGKIYVESEAALFGLVAGVSLKYVAYFTILSGAVSAFIIICSAHVHWFLRPLNAMRYAESHEISKYERR
jgi:TRAP-type uncharacterized transport system fused permease subunit